MHNPYTLAEDAFAQLSRLVLELVDFCDEVGAFATKDGYPRLIDGSDFKHYLIDGCGRFRLDDFILQVEVLVSQFRECKTIFVGLPVRPHMQSAYRDNDSDCASYCEVLFSIASVVIEYAMMFLAGMNVMADGHDCYHVSEPEPADALRMYWPHFVESIEREALPQRLGAIDSEIKRELRFAAGLCFASLPISTLPAPSSSELTPSELTPSELTPSELTPSELTPPELTPSELTPPAPSPLEPTPSEPTPSELTPSELTPPASTPPAPSPLEPTPVELTPPELTPPVPSMSIQSEEDGQGERRAPKEYMHGVTIDRDRRILFRLAIDARTDPLPPNSQWPLAVALLQAGDNGISLRVLMMVNDSNDGAIRTAITELRGRLQKIGLTVSNARKTGVYKLIAIPMSAQR